MEQQAKNQFDAARDSQMEARLQLQVPILGVCSP